MSADKWLAVKAIRFYQIFISPHKGYKCAHAHFRGGKSCSAASIDIVQANSTLQWPKLIKARLTDCKSVFQIESDKEQERRKRENKAESACYAADCCPHACDDIVSGCKHCDNIGDCTPGSCL